MKRFFTAATAACMFLTLSAEGYQINLLSARQMGMGHTGTGMKLGAESMFFNPAGLGFSDKTVDITGSVTGLKSIANATDLATGVKTETDNSISTPLAVNASFKIYDNLQCGISFYTPYGSAINWGKNWPGSVLSQKVNLATYTIQPTFAWRITDKLSVGAGLMMSWGNVDLNKGLVSGRSFDGLLTSLGMGAAATFGNTTPASVKLKGTSEMAFGVNLGVMYDINDKWTVGVNWRSKQILSVKKGDASVNYANEVAKTVLENKVGLIDAANFKAEMPMPMTLRFGVSYRPVKPLTLAFDAQFTRWKTYRELSIEFLDDNLKGFNQYIPKNYHNAWCFSMGGQYQITDRFTARAGLMLDFTPVDKSYYNPETPGMTKIEPTIGFSFQPTKRLAIDFSFMYVHGTGKDGASVTYMDMITQQPTTFTADYKVRAYAPSLGLRYSF